jgi:hypothetical protein
MKHISDENIYLYVINPALLGIEALRVIESHLEGCSECREFVSVAENFLNEYRKLKDLKLDSPEHAGKIEMLRLRSGLRSHRLPQFSSNSMVLKPFNFFTGSERRFSKLVAEQKPEDQDRFRHIYTYASAHKLVILRVLYNPAKKEYSLYLVCDDMSKAGNALINFEGEDVEYVTDNDGIIRLNRDFIAENVNVFIHLPISKFEIDLCEFLKKHAVSALISKEKITLNLSRLNGDVKATLDFGRKPEAAEIKAIILHGDNFDKHESYDLDGNSFFFPAAGYDKIRIVLVQKQ